MTEQHESHHLAAPRTASTSPAPARPAAAGAGVPPAAPFWFAGLLRRKLLICTVFVFISILTIPLVWLSSSPEYRSFATVRVEPIGSWLVFPSDDDRAARQYLAFMNTQAEILGGSDVLSRVIELPEIKDTFLFKTDNNPLTPGGSPMSCLRDSLEIAPRRDSEIIDVACTGPNPNDTKLIVNAVATEFEKVSAAQSLLKDAFIIEQLAAEYEELDAEIDTLEEAKLELTRQIGTENLAQLEDHLRAQLAQQELAYATLQREIDLIRWHIERLDDPRIERRENRPADDIAMRSRYATDVDWRNLDIAHEHAKYQLEVSETQYGEAHPRIAELNANIRYAEKVLREREQQLREVWKNNVPEIKPEISGIAGIHNRESLGSLLEARELEAGMVQDDLKRRREYFAKISAIASQVAQHNEKIDYSRRLQGLVRERLDALKIEANAPARISVASLGHAPSSPYRDRRASLTALAAAAALFISLMIGRLRHSMDPMLHGISESWSGARVPFLGRLPLLTVHHMPRELGGKSPVALAEFGDSENGEAASFMENVRMIRTGLLERTRARNERVVLVTGARPGTGKTSVAVLLARSLSSIGKRVLLVETDMRRPSLADRLGVAGSVGLVNIIDGSATDSEAIHRATRVGFDILPVGKTPYGADPEILANGTFGTSIQRWRTRYDYILLDSPPVLSVADAQILAAQADATLMVLRSLHDRRTEVAEAYARLSATGGKLIGTILLGEQNESRSYGYGYTESGSSDRLVAAGA